MYILVLIYNLLYYLFICAQVSKRTTNIIIKFTLYSPSLHSTANRLERLRRSALCAKTLTAFLYIFRVSCFCKTKFLIDELCGYCASAIELLFARLKNAKLSCR